MIDHLQSRTGQLYYYHGSPHQGLEFLRPTRGHLHASPDLAFASLFLLSNVGFICCQIDGKLHAAVPVVPQVLIEKDRGGSIYLVSSTHFQPHASKDLRSLDWSTTEPVRPERAIELKASLLFINLLGGTVYCIGKAEYQRAKRMLLRSPRALIEIFAELRDGGCHVFPYDPKLKATQVR